MMIKKLICFLKGHLWKYGQGLSANIRECERCGKYQWRPFGFDDYIED